RYPHSFARKEDRQRATRDTSGGIRAVRDGRRRPPAHGDTAPPVTGRRRPEPAPRPRATGDRAGGVHTPRLRGGVRRTLPRRAGGPPPESAALGAVGARGMPPLARKSPVDSRASGGAERGYFSGWFTYSR